MVTYVNYMYHGEHFVMHINVELLSNTPETNKILCQLDLDKKKNKRVYVSVMIFTDPRTFFYSSLLVCL